MPTKNSQDVFDFIDLYKRYSNACGYAKDWNELIAGLAQELQAHSQYLIALDVAEQNDVQANLATSTTVKIKVPSSANQSLPVIT